MNLAKKKKKKTIYLISALIATVAIGGMVYWIWPKKETKTETKSTTEQKISQLQQQLNQIKNALTTLNHNITQTETSLQAKRTEQIQTPQDSLQTQINQLETQLTTYKSQKKKLETIIPKLEQQINNLAKGENNSNQEQIINDIEKEIKEVNEELGIKDEKKDDKPKEDKPKKDDSPGKDDGSNKDKKDNPNKSPRYQKLTPEQEWELAKQWNQKLSQLLDKMNKQYKEVFDNYDSIPQASKDIVDAMFDGIAKNFIESCRTNYNSNNGDKDNLKKFLNDSEYQDFTKKAENTQQAQLELIDSVIDMVLSNTKRQVLADISQFKKLCDFGEELLAELAKLGTTPKLQAEIKKLQLQKNILIICESKLNDDYNKADEHYSHRIPIMEQVWEQLEKLEWVNK